ncbi:MAG TPA: hypothetical protein VGB52_13700 [Actinomycetota bacterium]
MRGKVAYRYTDGNVEELVAGDVNHARPGHTPLMYAETELVEFSPTAELQKTMDLVLANLKEQG